VDEIAGKAAIAGVGQTDFSKNSGRSAIRLAVEAAVAAAEDAGIAPREIDGVIPFPGGPTSEDLIAALGAQDVTYTCASHMGGASPVASLRLAALAVATGQATAVLAFVARNGRSGARAAARATRIVPGQQFRRSLEFPAGFNTPAQWYSLICRRHMYEFGTTRQQLGAVALTMRAHAELNPHAMMYGRPLSMEAYLAAKPIAEPYHLYDCCLETDGASAVIVTSADRASDLPRRAAIIAGIAEGHAESPDNIPGRADIFETGLTHAAPRAFTQAGLMPGDVDVAMIYDCFTFEVIQQLEEAGFCKRGEGGFFVENGNIGLSGGLPVNPHGGLLSEGHTAGMSHIVEAVRQLRGECGERQVSDPRVVAVTGWGDMGDGALALLV
jgi:acetyl-CoA acetyltransferase